MLLLSGRINVDKPLYDLSTFYGRFQHFAWMTDPRTCVVSNQSLIQAKELVNQYRKGQEPSGTTPDDVKYAMKLYSSAFHPDSGELQNFAGRMSFQVRLNEILYVLILNHVILVTRWYAYYRCYVGLLSYCTANCVLAICESIV